MNTALAAVVSVVVALLLRHLSAAAAHGVGGGGAEGQPPQCQRWSPAVSTVGKSFGQKYADVHPMCPSANGGSSRVFACDGVDILASHCPPTLAAIKAAIPLHEAAPHHKHPSSATATSARTTCLAQRVPVSSPLAPAAFDMTPMPSCTPFVLVRNQKTGTSSWRWMLGRHIRRHGFKSKVDFVWGDGQALAGCLYHQSTNEPAPAYGVDGFLWVASMRSPQARVHSHYWQCLIQASSRACKNVHDKSAFVADAVQTTHQITRLQLGPDDTPLEGINQLDLVLLQERFDASVVLLHMKLGIRIVDMLQAPSKMRGHGSWNLTVHQQKVLRAGTAEEQLWYDYALARFNKTVEMLDARAGGGRFSAAVAHFRELNAAAHAACARFEDPKQGDEGTYARAKKNLPGSAAAVERLEACRREVCDRDAACRANMFDAALYEPVLCPSNAESVRNAPPCPGQE